MYRYTLIYKNPFFGSKTPQEIERLVAAANIEVEKFSGFGDRPENSILQHDYYHYDNHDGKTLHSLTIEKLMTLENVMYVLGEGVRIDNYHELTVLKLFLTALGDFFQQYPYLSQLIENHFRESNKYEFVDPQVDIAGAEKFANKIIEILAEYKNYNDISILIPVFSEKIFSPEALQCLCIAFPRFAQACLKEKASGISVDNQIIRVRNLKKTDAQIASDYLNHTAINHDFVRDHKDLFVQISHYANLTVQHVIKLFDQEGVYFLQALQFEYSPKAIEEMGMGVDQTIACLREKFAGCTQLLANMIADQRCKAIFEKNPVLLELFLESENYISLLNRAGLEQLQRLKPQIFEQELRESNAALQAVFNHGATIANMDSENFYQLILRWLAIEPAEMRKKLVVILGNNAELIDSEIIELYMLYISPITITPEEIRLLAFNGDALTENFKDMLERIIKLKPNLIIEIYNHEPINERQLEQLNSCIPANQAFSAESITQLNSIGFKRFVRYFPNQFFQLAVGNLNLISLLLEHPVKIAAEYADIFVSITRQWLAHAELPLEEKRKQCLEIFRLNNHLVHSGSVVLYISVFGKNLSLLEIASLFFDKNQLKPDCVEILRKIIAADPNIIPEIYNDSDIIKDDHLVQLVNQVLAMPAVNEIMPKLRPVGTHRFFSLHGEQMFREIESNELFQILVKCKKEIPEEYSRQFMKVAQTTISVIVKMYKSDYMIGGRRIAPSYSDEHHLYNLNYIINTIARFSAYRDNAIFKIKLAEWYTYYIVLFFEYYLKIILAETEGHAEDARENLVSFINTRNRFSIEEQIWLYEQLLINGQINAKILQLFPNVAIYCVLAENVTKEKIDILIEMLKETRHLLTVGDIVSVLKIEAEKLPEQFCKKPALFYFYLRMSSGDAAFMFNNGVIEQVVKEVQEENGNENDRQYQEPNREFIKTELLSNNEFFKRLNKNGLVVFLAFCGEREFYQQLNTSEGVFRRVVNCQLQIPLEHLPIFVEAFKKYFMNIDEVSKILSYDYAVRNVKNLLAFKSEFFQESVLPLLDLGTPIPDFPKMILAELLQVEENKEQFLRCCCEKLTYPQILTLVDKFSGMKSILSGCAELRTKYPQLVNDFCNDGGFSWRLNPNIKVGFGFDSNNVSCNTTGENTTGQGFNPSNH